MNKVITQDEFQNAVTALGETVATFHGNRDERINKFVEVVAQRFGVTIESPPILPGVRCASECAAERVTCDIHTIAEVYGSDIETRDANRKVVAGSKKLVELVVEWFRYAGWKYKDNDPSPYCRVIDQLETMDVDVTEFRA